jgi:hypothetical protein
MGVEQSGTGEKTGFMERAQPPKKLQIPSSNTPGRPLALHFGVWVFFGIWSLGFWSLTRNRMTNDEIRMTNQIRNPKAESSERPAPGSDFGLRHSFDIRHSGLVIFHRRLPATDNES